MFVNYWQVRSVAKYLKLCTYNSTNTWLLLLHKPSLVKLSMRDINIHICEYILCQHLVAAILVKDFDLCAVFCNSHQTHWVAGRPCALPCCHLTLKRINFGFLQTHSVCCFCISLHKCLSHFTFDSNAVVICCCKPNASTKEDISISLFA